MQGYQPLAQVADCRFHRGSNLITPGKGASCRDYTLLVSILWTYRQVWDRESLHSVLLPISEKTLP